MTAKDKEVFSENKLFSKLGTEVFEGWIKSGKAFILSVKKGEAVMENEKFSRCLAMIISGKASVRKTGFSGNKTVINTLSEGDVFGMATLFYEEESFPSIISAESPLRLAVFPKDIIIEAFETSPEFAKAYATLLSEKIHFLNKKLSAFTEGESPEKLLRLLLTAAEGKKEFILPCSVTKLAQMLGIGRASVYRAFDELEQRGEIKKEGKTIILLKN